MQLPKPATRPNVHLHTDIPAVQFAYNSSIHAVTKFSPHFLTYGQRSRLPIDSEWKLRTENPLSYPEYAATLAQRLQTAWEAVRKLSRRRQKLNKDEHDRRRASEERPIAIGDLVLLEIPVRQNKMGDRWRGPWIVKMVRKPNVDIEDQASGRRTTVHLNRVKRFFLLHRSMPAERPLHASGPNDVPD
ncbi:hypothetical protein L596_005999 [Steinernema carpocapsae]|uniref:Integrase catalytic domain-containing protein n=1 Tax=Steinernema carpocapsae TaxID=34508 RepID=A0A4U8V0S5_STECR|nr:hypothetical protein L596_005999 [Steinernema carpocapsae]